MVREAVCTNVKSCIFPQSWTTVAQTGCALLLYALSGDAAHFSCFLTAGIFRSSTRLNDWTWSCIITLAFIISSVTLPSIMVVIAVAASAVAASAAIVEEVVLFQTAVVKVDFFSSFVVYTNSVTVLSGSFLVSGFDFCAAVSCTTWAISHPMEWARRRESSLSITFPVWRAMRMSAQCAGCIHIFITYPQCQDVRNNSEGVR